jgi:para-nitrobenzyl esterase
MSGATRRVGLALLLAGTLPAAAVAQGAGPVRTDKGLVAGIGAPGGVRIFEGIPFAAPPVGARRWQAPHPVPRWTDVLSATRFRSRCMQLPIFSDMVFRSPGVSEDCLYLNVWTPAGAATERLPVLLYFYGGGYVAGDASEWRYDGASLARHGVVVVTANYRLGAFGFLAYPALTRESPHHASGDYGLLDQVAALEWVRRNIAAFGGDPKHITIGGESAGSMSVSALMASPLSRGLIAGAIGESGALIHPTFTPVPLADAERRGVAFASDLGVVSLAALRALPADSLLQATRQVRFPVTIDGYFLPASPEAILHAGNQARVPLLVGWNSEESSWRALLRDQDPTPEHYADAVRGLFGAHADSVLRYFPGETPEQVKLSGTLLAGAGFTVLSTWKWAELQHQMAHRPVYRYVFAHPRPPTREPSPNPAPEGAVHSAEIEYALGNLATNHVYAWAPADDSLSAAMEAYFANFVKTGDPNGAGLPRWPAAYAGDTVRVMVFDARPHAEPAPHRAAWRFLDRYDSTTRP